jgi:hypothetical protein
LQSYLNYVRQSSPCKKLLRNTADADSGLP